MSKDESEYVTVGIPAKLNFMRVVRDAIGEAALDFGFPEEDAEQIIMAVDEAATNVVQHGYSQQEAEKSRLYLQVFFSRTRLVVELIDRAARFSPLEERGLTVEEFLASGKSHGFGLYVVRTFVDQIEHDYKEGEGNRLRLIKELPVAPKA